MSCSPSSLVSGLLTVDLWFRGWISTSLVRSTLSSVLGQTHLIVMIQYIQPHPLLFHSTIHNGNHNSITSTPPTPNRPKCKVLSLWRIVVLSQQEFIIIYVVIEFIKHCLDLGSVSLLYQWCFSVVFLYPWNLDKEYFCTSLHVTYWLQLCTIFFHFKFVRCFPQC